MAPGRHGSNGLGVPPLGQEPPLSTTDAVAPNSQPCPAVRQRRGGTGCGKERHSWFLRGRAAIPRSVWSPCGLLGRERATRAATVCGSAWVNVI